MPPPPPTIAQIRDGLTFGIGLGVGSLRADCPDDECSAVMEAMGVDGHVGWMLAPHFELMAESWIMVHRESFLTVYQVVNTVGVRYWLTPKIWVKGGLGNATAGYKWRGIFRQFEDETEAAPGAMVGIGYEVLVRGNRSLDLHLKYGTGAYDAKVAGEYVVKGQSIQAGVNYVFY
jgi:hypothetical protein